MAHFDFLFCVSNFFFFLMFICILHQYRFRFNIMMHQIWPQPNYKELRTLSPFFPYVVCTICLAHVESADHLSSHIITQHMAEHAKYLHDRFHFPDDRCSVCGELFTIVIYRLNSISCFQINSIYFTTFRFLTVSFTYLFFVFLVSQGNGDLLAVHLSSQK